MGDTKDVVIAFISVYGWAILIVVVALGSLWYFGVVNPDNLLASKGLDRTCCEGLCGGYSQMSGQNLQCMQFKDGYAICGTGQSIYDDELVSVSQRIYINLDNISSCNYYWMMNNQTVEGQVSYQTPFIENPKLNLEG